MDDVVLLEQLALEARRVVATDGNALDAPVPWCGDWQVADVIGHLSGVQRWATALSNAPGRWMRRRDMEAPPQGAAVLAWCADSVEPMISAFEGTDLDEVVNTWAGEQPRRWWLRRLAHETAVHRWDADAGSSGPAHAQPIDAELAVDGIDELFDNFYPLIRDKATGEGQSMHLHATDAEGEWSVHFDPEGGWVDRVHAKGDVAVRGPASELLLLLWNRPTPEPTAETFGDASLITRWHDLARF